jgi:hypothetical protein
MTDPSSKSDLHNEFEQLGQNLKAALKTAWESEESRQLQAELKSGLAALEVGLRQAAQEVTTGETGQRLKAEVEDLGQRVKSGEVENKLRHELLAALRSVNSELQKRSGQGGSSQA